MVKSTLLNWGEFKESIQTEWSDSYSDPDKQNYLEEKHLNVYPSY